MLGDVALVWGARTEQGKQKSRQMRSSIDTARLRPKICPADEWRLSNRVFLGELNPLRVRQQPLDSARTRGFSCTWRGRTFSLQQ